VAARHLDWEGCFNTRDLGGLPTLRGPTRFGRIVRSDSLSTLTADGWAALEAYGIRTVVDLRNEDEIGPDAAPRPGSIETIHVPLDGSEDREFWDVWENGLEFGTPLYYRPHLERLPERSAAVLAAIARAAPGGVAFHCVGGRDRAGQVAMLVLALAGVEPEAIAADYGLSPARLGPLYEARGQPNPEPELERFLRERGTSAGEVIVATLSELDLERTLAAGGLEPADLARLRERLLGEAG
jgi:protein tyrosine/serine phosphatase